MGGGQWEKGSSNYFLPNCILSPLHFLFLKLSGQILGPELTLKSIFSFSLCQEISLTISFNTPMDFPPSITYLFSKSSFLNSKCSKNFCSILL